MIKLYWVTSYNGALCWWFQNVWLRSANVSNNNNFWNVNTNGAINNNNGNNSNAVVLGFKTR